TATQAAGGPGHRQAAPARPSRDLCPSRSCSPNNPPAQRLRPVPAIWPDATPPVAGSTEPTPPEQRCAEPQEVIATASPARSVAADRAAPLPQRRFPSRPPPPALALPSAR